MPEVAGNAAVLVDPFSTESITEGIARLARGKEIQEHKDRGARRCRDFSWSRTAQVVADAIRA
jgi:glycosyltransferase involved in cell wall biosynthesis